MERIKEINKIEEKVKELEKQIEEMKIKEIDREISILEAQLLERRFELNLMNNTGYIPYADLGFRNSWGGCRWR